MEHFKLEKDIKVISSLFGNGFNDYYEFKKYCSSIFPKGLCNNEKLFRFRIMNHTRLVNDYLEYIFSNSKDQFRKETIHTWIKRVNQVSKSFILIQQTINENLITVSDDKNKSDYFECLLSLSEIVKEEFLALSVKLGYNYSGYLIEDRNENEIIIKNTSKRGRPAVKLFSFRFMIGLENPEFKYKCDHLLDFLVRLDLIDHTTSKTNFRKVFMALPPAKIKKPVNWTGSIRCLKTFVECLNNSNLIHDEPAKFKVACLCFTHNGNAITQKQLKEAKILMKNHIFWKAWLRIALPSFETPGETVDPKLFYDYGTP